MMAGSSGWAYKNPKGDGNQKKLIVIFLRGGIDGLNVVVPHGDSEYYNLRPTIAVAKPGQPNGALDLDGHFWPQSRHASVDALLAKQDSGICARIRFAGSNAFALRRSGQHGIRTSRPEKHSQRMAQPTGFGAALGPQSSTGIEHRSSAPAHSFGTGHRGHGRTGRRADAHVPRQTDDRRSLQSDVRRQKRLPGQCIQRRHVGTQNNQRQPEPTDSSTDSRFGHAGKRSGSSISQCRRR